MKNILQQILKWEVCAPISVKRLYFEGHQHTRPRPDMFQQMMHGSTCRGDESDWFMNERTIWTIGYTIHLHAYESNETVWDARDTMIMYILVWCFLPSHIVWIVGCHFLHVIVMPVSVSHLQLQCRRLIPLQRSLPTIAGQ